MTRPFLLRAAQYPIEAPANWDEWRTKIAAWVEDAARAKVQLLVFPEYASMELASLDPSTAGDLYASVRTVMAFGPAYLDHHKQLAARYGVTLLAGSIPCALPDGRIVNRAHLITPHGQSGHQDKIVMTRFEREHWGISGGDTLRVFRTALGMLGISTCYDIEFPMIARSQAEAGAHLILAASCTDTMQGYWRVRIGAQARALENQCFVVQSPTVGMAPWSPVLDANYGAAGVFGPPDGDSPDDGVLTSGELNISGHVDAVIDLARVARWREQGAVRPFAHWPEQYLGAPAATISAEIVVLD